MLRQERSEGMKRKNWKQVSAAVVMAIVLAGCGNGGGTPKEETSQGEVNPKEEMQKGSEVRASFVEKNKDKKTKDTNKEPQEAKAMSS